MKARHYGRIVNTLSHVGYLGTRGRPEYAAAKAGLHGLTRSIAIEAAEYGIAVNGIAPGAMTRRVHAIPGIPERFTGGAFDADLDAPTVVWLAHEECSAKGEVFGVMAGTTTRIKIAENRRIPQQGANARRHPRQFSVHSG